MPRLPISRKMLGSVVSLRKLSSTRGAERMTDGDGAAVRVDTRVLEVDLHQLEAAEHLAREGFVDLDDVHILQLQTRSLQRARDCVRGSDAHDARLDAGARRGPNPCQGF